MEPDSDHDHDQQFWQGLGVAISVHCTDYEQIDDCLRNFVELAACSDKDYFLSEDDIARCCYGLLDAPLFQNNKDYVRRQFVFGLLQEDDARILHIMAAVLLYDGRSDEATFEMMQSECVFPHLVSLIQGNTDDDTGLHRMLLELLSEMSRIQRLSWEDLATVDDTFIIYLFQLIEQLSDDASDPYHYPIIRVLLVLNEQYMCYAVETLQPGSTTKMQRPLTNRILKVLSNHGPVYRTFGENLILLLNRESALGPQLLILKLLYLLFTTPPTYEYFYTNDLHVLVDVIIRNLLNLDPGPYDDDESHRSEGGGQRALRHTYLRVLYPLLKNTQLSQEDRHYKRDELRKLLHLLVYGSSMHFAPADETIVRLVARCRQVDWIKEEGDDLPLDHAGTSVSNPPKDHDVAKKLLGMNLAEAGVSSLSVLDVTAKVEKEKPMVPAPRRRGRKQAQSTPDAVGKHPALLKTPSELFAPSEHSGGRSPFDDEAND